MRARGFTLIEVMVALFVIALGVGALLSTLSSSASSITYMRDRSFAQWIAFNRLAELRLSASRPAQGVKTDTVEYANRSWQVEQEVSESGIGDLLRIDVRVASLAAEGTEAPRTAESEPLHTIGSAIGFIGPALARPNGLTPEWSLRVPAPGGPGGLGGPGGPGGPGTPGEPGAPGGGED